MTQIYTMMTIAMMCVV